MPDADSRSHRLVLRISRCLVPSIVLFNVLLLGSSVCLATELEAAALAFAAGDYHRTLSLVSGKDLDPEASLLRARTLIKLGQFSEARRLLKGLLKQLPHMRDLIRFLQGETLFGLLQFRQAASLFRDAARAKRSHWVDLARRRQAEALMAGDMSRAAIKQFQSIVRTFPQHPDRPELELALAKCLQRIGRRGDAAVRLTELWIRWPASRAAGEARMLLDDLEGRGLRVKKPSFDSRIQQIRTLRREKLYEQALVELARLRRRLKLSEEQLVRIDLERAKVYLKYRRPSQALPLLRHHFDRRASLLFNTIRGYLADCLGQLDRVEEGLKVILQDRAGRQNVRAQMGQAVKFLKRHGRYARALQLYRQQVAHLPQDQQDRMLLNRAWLAYRAGDHELAIRGFRHLRKFVPREKRFSLYWEARAEARAGRQDKAVELYQQLVERHLRNYYGMLARSRLVEAKKLTLSSSSCSPSTQPTRTGLSRDDMIPVIIDRLITRHLALYPSLKRVKTLWRLGMMEDAIRELHLIAMDFSWIRARGRVRWDERRLAAERFWRGGPPIRRRWTRREREIFKERAIIGPDLGELFHRAGLYYYGWRFNPQHSDPVRQRYPRGYPEIVTRTSRTFGLDPNLIWAVMRTESAFRNDAISKAGARGLMQIMPLTARRIAEEMKLQDFHLNNLFDPEVSLRMAGWYLKRLIAKFKGQIPLVAAGYNGGPHNVALWLDQRGRFAEMDEFIEEIPFSESRRYAKKIVRLMALYERVHCGKDDRVVPNKLDHRYGEFPSF